MLRFFCAKTSVDCIDFYLFRSFLKRTVYDNTLRQIKIKQAIDFKRIQRLIV